MAKFRAKDFAKNLTGLMALCAFLGLAAFASSASAATYMFHFVGDPTNPDYGNVVINGEFVTSGSLLPSSITSISGTVSFGSGDLLDGTITGLSPYADADNVLYNVGTANDYSFGGVSFTVLGTDNTTTADYNLYVWNNATYLLVSTVDSVGYPQNGTPAASGPDFVERSSAFVSAVPESATWLLLLLGFGAAGVAMRRRSNNNVGAFA